MPWQQTNPDGATESEAVTMQRTALGDSELVISPIGLGTWAMGGSGWGFAWGSQDDAASRNSIHAAIDAGVNWIDTAPVYGLGHSEEVVGRALTECSSRPYIFTKCGLVWDGQNNVVNDLTRRSVRFELEASLQRLGVDVIDLYQIHWPIPFEQVGEAIEELLDCQACGLIRYVGLSNFGLAELMEYGGDPRVVSLQAMYSLVNRAAAQELFPQARKLGVGVLAYSTMMSGLLSGAMTPARISDLPSDDWRRTHPEFTQPRLAQNLKLVELLEQVGHELGVSAGELAIAWALRQPLVTGTVVGARDPTQTQSFVRAASLAASEASLLALDEYIATYDPLPDTVHQKAFRGEL